MYNAAGSGCDDVGMSAVGKLARPELLEVRRPMPVL